MEEPADFELMANRFDRLVKELLQGEIRRTSFHPWEVHLLLDLEECRLTRSRREEALRRYQKAVRRQIERRQLPPVRFADFVGRKARKAALVPPVSPRGHDATALHP